MMGEYSYIPKSQELIPNKIYSQADQIGDKPAYWVLKDGEYQSTNWTTYVEQIEQVAKSLIALKLDEQETIGILGFNRPEWTITAHAAMIMRAVPVGIYTTCSSEDISYVVDHASMSLVMVENLDQYHRVKAIKGENPQLKYIICMESIAVEDIPDDQDTMSWQAFLAAGSSVNVDAIHTKRKKIDLEDLATLIYTSGTTGQPKGVMLSHRAITSAAWTLNEIVDLTPEDRFLSYLPLSHIVEQVISLYGPAYVGFSIYFAQSMDTIADNIKQSKPTIFFGVPRIWEKFYEGITVKLGAATGVKKIFADFAQHTGRAYYAEKMAGNEPSKALEIKYKIAHKLVYSKLKTALGLDEARAFFSGAAPLSSHIMDFFTGLDLQICEAYGLSENAGPGSFNLPESFKIGSVGKPVPGVEIKIAEDGEILLFGPVVFSGYYKNPTATEEALKEGWLHTGDLGSYDDKGFLSITGRKKDVIITAGGKNIAPRKIEEKVEKMPLVEHCLVVGDRRKFMSALITINQEALGAWAKERNKSMEEIYKDTDFVTTIATGINEVNEKLARVEQIREYRLLDNNFSIDEGDLTPTLKVKRQAILQKYDSLIEEIYA